MAAPMLTALLLQTLTAVADGQTYTGTYTEHAAHSVYNNFDNYRGGEHLDHCDLPVNGADECRRMCDEDCECHCYFLHSSGTCQRRHTCDPDSFEEGQSDFTVFVKDEIPASCTVFEDLNMHTTCAGDGLQHSLATGVHNLTTCKNICAMLSHECIGIQYSSNCVDHTADECLIYTAGTITGGTPTDGSEPMPSGATSINPHCLRYNGAVGSSGNSVFVPVTATMTGIDGAAVLADQAAFDAVGTAIKETIATETGASADDVFVELRTGSLIADIQVIAASSAANFVNIRDALTGADLGSVLTDMLGNLTAIDSFLDGTALSVAAVVGPAGGTVTATTATDTDTTQTTPDPNATTTEATTTTQGVSQCSGFDLRLSVLGALLMRFIIA